MQMRKAFLGLVPVLALAACVSAPADDKSGSSDITQDSNKDLTLADVQRAIKASGATWTAGATPAAAIPKAERGSLFGLPLDSLPQETMTITNEGDTKPPTASATPAAWDWRSVNGQSFVSPVLDQGRCGSCVAFSTVATFETQLNIAEGVTSSPWQLSPEYLFECGGGACGFGWNVGPAAKFVVSKGIPDNACMPYSSGATGVDGTCSQACPDVAHRVQKAQAYTTPTTGAANVDAVKRALQNGPLVTTLTVYDDFMFYTSGVYKHVTGSVAGGHAVSIVGWNDADQAWIVRNSWGAGWGMNGFFEIAWSDTSGLGAQTWGFTVAPPGAYVSFPDVRDNRVLTGTVTLPIETQQVTGAVSWTMTPKSGTATTGTATSAGAVIDTTKLADGVYTLQAHAGTVDGPSHLVYVLNGTETGNLKFKTLTSGQTLTGVATIDVAVTASPIPATSITWTVQDGAGTTIINRSSDNTGATVQMGWNTKARPNGNYTVTVSGSAGTQALAPASVQVTLHN
jgi:hypothetical protein